MNRVKGKSVNAFQQDTISRKGVVFYINQPLGFVNKFRIKAGYKFEKRSTLLLILASFHNKLSSVKFNGIQLCSEYQYVIGKSKNSENFIYGKAGFGNYNFTGEKFNLIYNSSTINGSGSYLLIGVGFGQELFLNKSKTLSIQFNEGVKFNKIIQSTGSNIDNRLYYPLNPGSLVDLNINFGFKF